MNEGGLDQWFPLEAIVEAELAVDQLEVEDLFENKFWTIEGDDDTFAMDNGETNEVGWRTWLTVLEC